MIFRVGRRISREYGIFQGCDAPTEGSRDSRTAGRAEGRGLSAETCLATWPARERKKARSHSSTLLPTSFGTLHGWGSGCSIPAAVGVLGGPAAAVLSVPIAPGGGERKYMVNSPDMPSTEILELFLSGESLRKISASTGLSRDRVRQVVMDAGEPIRSHRAIELPQDPSWWVKQFDNECSVAGLATRLGTNQMHIYRHLRRIGVPSPRSQSLERWVATRTAADGDCLRWLRSFSPSYGNVCRVPAPIRAANLVAARVRFCSRGGLGGPCPRMPP